MARSMWCRGPSVIRPWPSLMRVSCRDSRLALRITAEGLANVPIEGTVVRDNCRLHEVSLCREPAYAKALVMAVTVKTANGCKELEIPTLDDEQKERLRAVGIEV